MTRRGWMVLAIVALATCGSALADTLILEDGRTITGKLLTPADAPSVKIETPMGTLEFSSSMIKEVKVGDAAPPAAPPAGTAPSPTATPGQPAETPPDAGAAAKVDPAFRAKYAEGMKSLATVTTGAEGLALLDGLLKDCPAGELADSIRNTMKLWKDRADKNLVKFGPPQGMTWIPKPEADARKAKADELVTKADAEAKSDDAAKLYDQASQQDPARVDIPMKKAMRFYKDKNMAKFGAALGDVVKIEPNNVCARNDMGVEQAQAKLWGAAMANVSKAAMFTDNDKALDNLDQVAAMADADDGTTHIAYADSNRTIQLVVAQFHNQKKHVGENRWGNTWIKEADYQANLAKNADVDKLVVTDKQKLANIMAQGRQAEAAKAKSDQDLKNYQSGGYGATSSTTRVLPGGYGTTSGYGYVDPYVLQQLQTTQQNLAKQIIDLTAAMKKAQDEIKTTEGTKVQFPHAGKLVLFDTDGKAELESIAITAPPAKTGG